MLSAAPAFLVGFVGAVLIEILPILELRRKPRHEWPEWVKSKDYWLLSLVGFVIGGGIASAYATASGLSWYIALNVGAAWPAVIAGLAKGTGEIRPKADSIN